MAEKSSVRTGVEFSATVIAVVGAVWAGKAYFENWMLNTINAAVEEKVVVIEQLQLADLLVYYEYPDDAISELRKISDRLSAMPAEDKRKISFYDNYLDAIAQSENTLKYEPEIRMLTSVFSNEMQTHGWHDEYLAYVTMFLPEARGDQGFFASQVVGRLNLAVHQYDVDGDIEGLESAFHTLALAYLCQGDEANAQSALEQAAEMSPLDYYLIYPMVGADELAEDPKVEKLNAVCPNNVSRGYSNLLNTLASSEDNPFRELLSEYAE